jgi:hypothetical protein
METAGFMWQPEVDPAIESSATVRANMASSANLDAPKRGESATNMERKKVVTNSIAYAGSSLSSLRLLTCP